MTTDETLQKAWQARLRLWAESNKLRAESNKFWVTSSKLWVEGSKLWAESDRLRAEGGKLWADAIWETYGNITFEWKNWNAEFHSFECHLGNGEVFGFSKKEKEGEL